ncbi:GxxExxY protein [Roseibacillus persicicus]|uniref:GxxExxY protein n=1 Tax=Roseibacillus persicicus TaxID=454148 RepID=A0A918TYY4_9BACT|nr:GxxExxY protein [Roseibacillus persicicus]GHC62996.1 hypothetical protein GCM10007100_32970 [Roseibacillus persicicus]
MEQLTGKVIGCAMAVHRELGPGFLESVYQKALSIELNHQRVPHAVEAPLAVHYRSQLVGEFKADILVQECLILELKAVTKLIDKHEVQTVNYLTATGINVGLLFNFGSQRLEFKKKFRIYRPTNSTESNPA